VVPSSGSRPAQDERLGIGELIEQHLADGRGKNTQLPFADLLRQSVHSRLAGCEDVNDVARLAQDPTLRLISSRRIWQRGATLGLIASPPAGPHVVFDYRNPPTAGPHRDEHDDARKALVARVDSLGESFRSEFETEALHTNLDRVFRT